MFFLEEAPRELKSIVEFLNGQMERTEVLVVEARQFTDGMTRVVAPTLFPYTEQARLPKRKVAPPASARKRWDEAAFFQDASTRLSGEQKDAIAALYEYATGRGYEIRWGTGGDTGSFNLVLPAVSQKSVMSVYTNGTIALNFGWLATSEDTVAYRDALANEVRARCGFPVPDVERFVYLSIDRWATKRADLVEALEAARRANWGIAAGEHVAAS